MSTSVRGTGFVEQVFYVKIHLQFLKLFYLFGNEVLNGKVKRECIILRVLKS